ncbi:N-acetylmuramoyl-L-alanine amidase [Kitasatospora sp. LaBMicrA B282]|uniref:N-acetylmuramoyl-L-alanine amidase n=1 Tax=Kitasatospora sp. LaBMicrA B282 TaxID=3420949 RepID=UPI003D132D31
MPRTPTALTLTAALGLGLAAPALAVPPAPDRATLLQRQFTAAAAEFGVPERLLLALSYQETRWESHGGEPSTTGNYGVLGLTEASVPDVHSLDDAAGLIHRAPAELRADSAANLRGGAALLTEYQRAAGAPVSTDPSDWYPAVVAFGRAGASDPGAEAAGRVFADRVFRTLRLGAARTTPEGQRVVLPADPGLRVPAPAARSHGAPSPDWAAECPSDLGCDVTPAAYALTDPKDPTSFGNYSKAARPQDGQRIEYIVIHDTESDYQGAIASFQNPNEQATAHYLVRSRDGHVTQLVRTADVAWHAGNKTVNMHSIGIEHEGYAFPKSQPTWYSEQLYESSAELVRYLADRFEVPLDRQHIIGHDDVPGPTQHEVASMHWDPGTFWDWAHYLELLGAPLDPGTDQPPVPGGTVTIAPPFDGSNEPPVNDMAARPENFVYLRTAPAADAPLIAGAGQDASDWHDKAVTGARYVVAEERDDWTAIWYGGQKCWFFNPGGHTARTDRDPGLLLTPRPGLVSIPVYGRAYPEAAAYRPYPGIANPPAVVALDATIAAGQAYPAAATTPEPGQFYYDQNINGDAPDDRTLVVGKETYYPIRFNHRLAFVKASDVQQAG